MLHFVQLLKETQHQKGMRLATNKIPKLAKALWKSRFAEQLFSVATEKTIDPMNDSSYSVDQESQFLIHCFSSNHRTENSLRLLESNNIMMKSGSKVFLHRDKDGKVLAMVVAPLDGQLKSSSDVLSAIGTSSCDTHAMQTDCTMALDT